MMEAELKELSPVSTFNGLELADSGPVLPRYSFVSRKTGSEALKEPTLRHSLISYETAKK
jgi:hypothetical protein